MSSLMPLLLVVQHTAVIYLFLMLTLMMLGHRQLGQLTVIDLVVIIVLGSAVETAMVNGDTSLVAGLVCTATLLILNRLFAVIFLRYKRLRHLIVRGPILLVHDGKFVDEHLKRIGLTRADVLEALREHEQADITHIRFAVMEADGSINVVPMEAKTYNSKHVRQQTAPSQGSGAPEGQG
jgi:uncharacterized membrane protein YcaP (DUF421 family)